MMKRPCKREFTHYVGIYTGYSLELYKNGDLVSYKPL